MLSATHAFGERLRRSMAVPPFKIRGLPPFQSLAIYKIDDRFLNPTLESKQIENATQFCVYFLYRNHCVCTGPPKGLKKSKIAVYRDVIPPVSVRSRVTAILIKIAEYREFPRLSGWCIACSLCYVTSANFYDVTRLTL